MSAAQRLARVPYLLIIVFIAISINALTGVYSQMEYDLSIAIILTVWNVNSLLRCKYDASFNRTITLQMQSMSNPRIAYPLLFLIAGLLSIPAFALNLPISGWVIVSSAVIACVKHARANVIKTKA